MKVRHSAHFFPLMLCIILGICDSVSGQQDASDDDNDFADLDLSELMNIEVVEVSSLAGVDQSLLTTPAAMSVITSKDMKQTGHRLIPEALRLVPGMQVGRINSSQWGISARGFPSRFANKLQVLMDGRVVFEPQFAGTFWHEQDLIVEDLDQIEVIRGPGATLWGSNAVNGVINILSKPASETQGLFVSAGTGINAQHMAAIRYGGQLGETGHYRVWGQYRDQHEHANATGGGSGKDWAIGRGGIRFDWAGDHDLKFTLEGLAYVDPHFGETVRLPVPGAHLTTAPVSYDGHGSGASLRFRIENYDSNQDGWTFQSYYDRAHIEGVNGFELTHDVVETDFRQNMQVHDNHRVMWGLNYRYVLDDTVGTPVLFYLPASESYQRFMAFIQDTITITEGRLFAMVGSKFEYNEFTGFEWQPSGRMWWTPDDRQTIWWSISRPVRTPARVDRDLVLIASFADTGLLGGGPASGIYTPLALTGSRAVESETLLAYEAGYRSRLTDDLTLDVAVFYNDYDLIETPPSGFGAFGNIATAESYGVETQLDWSIAENWTITGTHAFLRVHLHGIADTADEFNSPEHRATLRTTYGLTDDIDLHAGAYYVDTTPGEMVPSYIRLDVGMTWRPSHNVEVSIWGQNLLDPHHPEDTPTIFADTTNQIERSIYAQISLTF